MYSTHFCWVLWINVNAHYLRVKNDSTPLSVKMHAGRLQAKVYGRRQKSRFIGGSFLDVEERTDDQNFEAPEMI